MDCGAELEAVHLDAVSHAEPGPARLADRARNLGIPVLQLGAGVLGSVADTSSPQGVLAVARLPLRPLDLLSEVEWAVACVGVQDPGNVGAIVRSAAAAGAGAVVCTEGTADPFGPKAVRASAGAVFSVPVVDSGRVSDTAVTLRREGLRLLGAKPAGGADYVTADLSGRVCLLLGTEGGGLPPAVESRLDQTVTIPMSRVDSLNVAMAATLLCFEVARRGRRAESRSGAGSTLVSDERA